MTGSPLLAHDAERREPVFGNVHGKVHGQAEWQLRRRRNMTQTSNRFFDEMARLMNDAAGVAQGVRREFDTLFRSQAERILRDLDVVQREEFEAVKEMARLAREENEALKTRIAALEAKAEKPGKKVKDTTAE
jgi:BMFP domain-containing protein YqiC